MKSKKKISIFSGEKMTREHQFFPLKKSFEESIFSGEKMSEA
jgi:hypothetical protein